MADSYGWVGKILIIDLTSKKVETVPTSNYVPKFIGGRALAAKLYWDEVPPACGALDPENRLIFATGPAGGTLGPGASRTAVAAKSPVTMPECYMYSVTGGQWAAELKFAGFDAVVVRGKAAGPSYVWIHDGEVEIKKADRLWGMTTNETDAEIRRLYGDQSRSMLIGPAGENLIKSAVILTDLTNATGTPGFGAVMGSKNLKAIIVRGTGPVKVARPQDLMAFYLENAKNGGKFGGPYVVAAESYGVFHGAPASLKATDSIEGRFNTEDSDWAQNHWLAYDEVKAGTIRQKFQGCFACPACCGLVQEAMDPTGDEKAPKNLDAPFVSAQQCHETPYWNEIEDEEFGDKRQGRTALLNASGFQNLGITTWCMSYHLNWVLDAVKAGLLTKENTGLPIGEYTSEEYLGPKGYHYGIVYGRNDFFKRLGEGELRFLANMAKENPAWKTIYERYVRRPSYWDGQKSAGVPGNTLAMLFEATSFRWRPNDSLAHFSGVSKQLDGLVPAAEVSKALAAVRAKWAPLLGAKSMDLGTEPKTFEDKVTSTIFLQNMQVEMDSMMYCGWMGFPRFYSLWTDDHLGDPSIGAKMLAAVTGIDRTFAENVGSFESAWTLERAIRVREGQRREHDWFIDATFEANKSWASKEVFSKVLDDYYKARGWAVDSGIPTRTQLEKLGMKDVADDLGAKYGVQVPA
jgi:aldehyde:ferredoxin oxidoreductase